MIYERRPGADRTDIVMAAKRRGWSVSSSGSKLVLEKSGIEIHAAFGRDGRLYRAGIKDGPRFEGQGMLLRLMIFLDTGH